jgi:hypothetical protein
VTVPSKLADRPRTARRAAAVLVAGLVAACSSPEMRRINQTMARIAHETGNRLARTGGSSGGGDAESQLVDAAANWATVALSQYRAQQTRSAGEEAKALHYKKSQGTVLKLRDASVTPTKAAPGQSLTFEMEYALLSDESEVTVQENWEVVKQGKVLAATKPNSQTREPGGWRTRASIGLPRSAKPGTYVVRNRVSAGKRRDVRETRFVVAAVPNPATTTVEIPAEVVRDPAIVAVQERLKELGHDPGTVDGRMSGETVAALKSFQRDYGLPVTGKADKETRAALGLDAKSSP